jgi:hypothetical protein
MGNAPIGIFFTMNLRTISLPCSNSQQPLQDYKLCSCIYLSFQIYSDYMQLVECPSIYEMLPNPEFKWKEKPIIQVWRKNPEKDGTVELVQYEATDCVSLFEEALRNNEVDSNITMLFYHITFLMHLLLHIISM